MKYKIGIGPEELEIGQYRAMNKGSLKAFFSLCLYPRGQKILDCRYFISGDNRWFTFPQKEIKYNDARKTDYIPYVSYLDKAFVDQLKIAVLSALKETESLDANKVSTGEKSQVQAESSANFEDLPF